MKSKKIFKVAILLIAVAIFGASFVAMKATKPSAAETNSSTQAPVQLVSAQVNHIYESGTQTGYYVSGYVSVANLAYAKKVTIRYSYDNTNWVDVPAKYVRTDKDGTEAWSFETAKIYPNQHYYRYPCTIAVKYEVNGQTYWDSNNGQNYYVCSSNAPAPEVKNVPVTLGKANVIQTYAGRSPMYGSSTQDNFYGQIAVKNLAYAKDIKVKYSTDNWKTFKEVKATFSQNLQNGVDLWSFEVKNLPKDAKVKYCISYTVNGQTYWDNNFGADYGL